MTVCSKYSWWMLKILMMNAQNTHTEQPMSQPSGWDMCCFSWVWSPIWTIAVQHPNSCCYDAGCLMANIWISVIQQLIHCDLVRQYGFVHLNENWTRYGLLWWQAITWTTADLFSIGQNFIKILITIHKFHSTKCIWKCHLQNITHFVLTSMC